MVSNVQILGTRTESPEILGALSTLSEFYDDNTPVARRRLRTTIEQNGLGINEQFIAAAKAIIKVGGCADTLLPHACKLARWWHTEVST